MQRAVDGWSMQKAEAVDARPGEGLALVARDLAAMVEREGNVRAVFGEPMKLESRVVIPVASVAMGGGGGGLRALGAAVDIVRRWLRRGNTHVAPSRTFLGGGGGGIDVRPVGFLSEQDGRVVFTPIAHRASTASDVDA